MLTILSILWPDQILQKKLAVQFVLIVWIHQAFATYASVDCPFTGLNNFIFRRILKYLIYCVKFIVLCVSQDYDLWYLFDSYSGDW